MLVWLYNCLDPISTLCFDAKGEKLVTGSFDESIKLWDFTARSVIHSIDSAHNKSNFSIHWF